MPYFSRSIFLLSLVFAAVGGSASTARAEDTLKTWVTKRVGGYVTTCGLRRQQGRSDRFIVEIGPGGSEYNWSPSAADWESARCEPDYSKPAATFEDVIKGLDKPPPSCAQLRQTWAKMTASERRDIAAVRSRYGPATDPCPMPR